MASCDSFRQLFDTPLSVNPSLYQIKSPQPIELSSFSEIFGELHFKETSESSSLPFSPPLSSSSSSSPSPHLDKFESTKSDNKENKNGSYIVGYNSKSDSFSSNSSESLQLCTEGLGVESFDDMEELNIEKRGDHKDDKEKGKHLMYSSYGSHQREYRRLKSFPPPISSIGRSGKPWVRYKSFRQDGRFVLKEMRVPVQEFLHSSREGGRLTMHLIQPNEDIQEDQEGKTKAECDDEYEDDEEAEDNDEDYIIKDGNELNTKEKGKQIAGIMQDEIDSN